MATGRASAHIPLTAAAVAPRRRPGEQSAPDRSGWRPLMSARARILGASVLLLALALAASTAVTHVFQVRQMNATVASELSHEITEFQKLAVHSSPAGSSGAVTTLLRTRTRQAVLENDVLLIGLVNGKIVTTSARSTAAALGAGPALLRRWSAVTTSASGQAQLAAGQARYVALGVRVPGDPARGVFVAAALTGRDLAAINRTTGLQLEVEAVALVLASIVAWLAAGRVLRPVRATTELARRITETDLAERIPARGHNEISELAVTFNRMLDRLEAALAAQRRFLADAGHELRTPITIVQGNLDTLEAGGPDDAETLAIVADELVRMTRLVDELLLLAGSDNPDFLHLAPVQLDLLTRALAAKARALDDRPWTLTTSAQGWAILDEQRITQAVVQLAANAVAHTPAGCPVEIGSAISGSTVEFTVADRGPGVPPGQRERIFDRFARLNPRRTAGAGLGLSIVAAIAAAHGGSVAVTGRDGGGAVFRLVLPYLSAPQPEQEHQP